MKKLRFFSVILSGLLISLAACEKDYLSKQTVKIDFPVSFSNDIIPILTEDCAVPTCHVPGGKRPDLTTSSAYDQLTQYGYVDPANPEGSVLYLRITSTTKPMPPTPPYLSAEEIGYILAWIEQGAQNN